MKKKGLVITLSISLVALISVPLTMNILAFTLNDTYTKTFYGEMKDKIELLKDKSKKRIILIGGSSVPFSVDSNYIKEYLNEYSPVDFGLYASLGTNFMLDIASNYISKEDIVIISPEISHQTLSMYYNGKEVYKALEQNKDLISKLDFKTRESLIGSTVSYVSEKISFLVNNNIPDPDDIYAHSSFNEYGDIKVLREGNIMVGGVDYNNPIILDEKLIENDFINYLNAFNDKCNRIGAKCYFRFSPMNDSSLINKDNIDNFYNYLNDKLYFDILGNPYHSMLEKEWFYDTNYHLNSYGVINWTKQLIRDIKLTLNDTSPTDIIEASKPALINPTYDIDGDNTHLDYFSYLNNGDSCYINSLKDNSLDTLIIPFKYEDRLITHFTSDVFKDNKTVKEITIQNNIRLINDYSFNGSSISKIIIDNDYPSQISIGDHLLDGCTAEIYVKKENLSKYKTNYSWSKYASKIKSL